MIYLSVKLCLNSSNSNNLQKVFYFCVVYLMSNSKIQFKISGKHVEKTCKIHRKKFLKIKKPTFSSLSKNRKIEKYLI